MNTKRLLGGVAAILALGGAASGAWADAEAVRAGIDKLLPGVKPDSVAASPVSGLYEVVMGPRLFYMSADGRYLIQGSVIDVRSRENITEAKLATAKKAAMERMGEDKMVIFAPEKPEHTITVFTDIDCGYCRKLHREIEDYNQEGIGVRYLFFPRAGVGSPSYQKAVSVWCSDDRKQALTDSKAGKAVENKTCDNPVQDHMLLGQAMGVTGTPAIVLEDGNMLPGYVPAKRMAEFLSAGAGPK